MSLRGFGWRHGGRRAWALRDVDLTIEYGERVLLLGPSGAGKSTLLAALAGLLPGDSGEREGTLTVGGSAGIVFQDPQSQLVMSRSGDDVAFGLENLGTPRDEIWPRVDEALRRVGFPYPRDRQVEALSGGEQQRLALAGALVARPDLLLLDEPTANLDPAGAALVREAIGRALGDATMVLVEHRVAEALPLVDRVVVLEPGGGIMADGAPAEVFARYGAALAAAGVWVPGSTGASTGGGVGLGAGGGGSTVGSGENLLTGADLTLRYAGAATTALPPTHIRVRAGESLAIVGPNGAGKSSLALLLGGLLAPTTGTLTSALAPGAPHRWPARDLARRIGSVFQNPEHQFVTQRVVDELTLAAPRARADELLDRLGLAGLAAANPYTLSGGEQRRLSVATALAAAPRVLVLDEPTFGQDLRTWRELVTLIGELRDAGHGLAIVTHDADFVAACADRVQTLGRVPGDASGSGLWHRAVPRDGAAGGSR
ncbi:ABC transporter ATP-binding protein [Longispora fulva]|uniref:Energy-coupling factor transport system ATP-binding protein n=1 Tax=Longispora fulva TaxID=619741 RepID=A0A8J7GW07_9ACTN|nr:ATP-binding cassette domain-containing protein [Longispora fulva]MBG6138556.1 energy-coupling factor transport system ATP-binding protein [Longispora fulva]